MSIDTINHNGNSFYRLQAEGFASKFAFSFAKELCKGEGLDIGCHKKEWALPGATPIDKIFGDEWYAENLPNKKYDYIFSSHCLEHLDDWVGALDYWTEHLKTGGVMFLYLSHYEQTYWRPWNNRKHIHILDPKYLRDYFKARPFHNICVTDGYDLNYSFYAIAEKK